MSILDWILIGAVLIGVFFAVRYMVKNKGGCSCSGGSCVGSCSSCKSRCSTGKRNKNFDI